MPTGRKRRRNSGRDGLDDEGDDEQQGRRAKGKKRPQRLNRIGAEDEAEDTAAAAVCAAVDRDLRAARAAEAAAAAGQGVEILPDFPAVPAAAAARAGSAGSGDEAEGADAAAAGDSSEADPTATQSDPYLLADAKYIEKDTRWRNKQRTLVFCSRGVTSRFRHLCEDVRRILPHHKTEPKFEKKSPLQEINEVCELKSCNNVVFFEARKKSDLYMYLARVPSGPTIKFQVLNIHTTAEVRLAGNCLHGSRPVLYFDRHFGEISFLRLVKTLFTQALGTPRNHPRSKPFHDHVICFYWLDHKIWFRHYQISPETPDDGDDPEKQALTEIGPRFVLDPIRILSGSFTGTTLYANAFYMSPTALRSQAKRLLKNPYVRRLEMKADRAEREKAAEFEEDPLDEVFK